MKELYKSPEVTVEELTKVDVLCASDGGGQTPGPVVGTNHDNTIASFTDFL